MDCHDNVRRYRKLLTVAVYVGTVPNVGMNNLAINQNLEGTGFTHCQGDFGTAKFVF